VVGSGVPFGIGSGSGRLLYEKRLKDAQAHTKVGRRKARIRVLRRFREKFEPLTQSYLASPDLPRERERGREREGGGGGVFIKIIIFY
jgi:hypothetical protein